MNSLRMAGLKDDPKSRGSIGSEANNTAVCNAMRHLSSEILFRLLSVFAAYPLRIQMTSATTTIISCDESGHGVQHR